MRCRHVMGVLAGLGTRAALVAPLAFSNNFDSEFSHKPFAYPWPTLATEAYTKSLHNTTFGCYKCLIFSYVGCKNQPCSSITQKSSFVTLIHVISDVELNYSTKSKTPKLCAERIGEFDGFCLCISSLNHQCFYLCGVSFIFIRGCINVTIDFEREKYLHF